MNLDRQSQRNHLVRGGPHTNNSSWMRIKHVALAVLLVGVSTGGLLWGVVAVLEQVHLRMHGATVQGSLQTTTLHRINFIPVEYSITVNYLDKQREFHVSRRLFYKYVRDDKFMSNAPIAVVYLPEDNSVSMPSEMLNVWIYWGSMVNCLGFAAIAAYTIAHLRKTLRAFR